MQRKFFLIFTCTWYNKTTLHGARCFLVDKRQGGFSLVELFAVILVTTGVLVPLLFSLVGNVQVNQRMNDKNAASLVQIAAIGGFNAMAHRDIRNLDLMATQGFVEFNADLNCDLLEDPGDAFYATNREICNLVFETTSANVTFDSEQFRVFVYPYYLTQAMKDQLLAYSDEVIPPEVKAEIAQITVVETVPTFNISRITVYIRYGDRLGDLLIRSGVIS